MGGDLGRRIAKLEQETMATARVYVWRDLGQTVDEALALRFPGGVPAGLEVTIYSWMDSEE
jgi:hypothetical protein